MAPISIQARDCQQQQLSVPTHLIGRLMGKGGATIQELTRCTGCRVHVPSRMSERVEHKSDTGSRQDELSAICVRGICQSNREDHQTQEMYCIRVIQLLCLENLSLTEALARADAERVEQERVEAECYQEEQRSLCVKRIRMSCPEFGDEDIRAALREACDDEDVAMDMLFSGFRCQKAAQADVARTQQSQQVEKEEFPALLPTAASLMSCSANSSSTKWCKRSAAVGRSLAPCASVINSVEAFPALPAPTPRPQTRGLRPLRTRPRYRN
eukprot:gnl/TRDRNA2_/TRDRNA2_179139_c0_seq1.p1 gnl/TRDRNA2_/TRDRNA2_179139_c0~~gnl/TRDRNA2_/TRDRNA2_179139_c0_seq1.p1  ORF type:complete len:270 (+),score=36.89 gnl/TRDRNA2_/TRDRNA2_179139_c0_seq1:86-895(+)